MKKLIIISSLVATLSASTAFAKTNGSYLGIDLLRSNANVQTSKGSSSGNTDTYWNNKSKDSQIGFGANYKYAINMNNFFIAPGLIYESIGSEAKIDDVDNEYSQSIKIKDRLGLKVDIGFDVTDNFAAYIPLGVASTRYEFKTRDYTSTSSLSTTTRGTDTSVFYGVGFAFYPTERVAVTLEYNRTKLNLKTGGDVALQGTVTLKAKTTMDIVKLGVSYQF